MFTVEVEMRDEIQITGMQEQPSASPKSQGLNGHFKITSLAQI